jgi:hypothetical protein
MCVRMFIRPTQNFTSHTEVFKVLFILLLCLRCEVTFKASGCCHTKLHYCVQLMSRDKTGYKKYILRFSCEWVYMTYFELHLEHFVTGP